jgi:hypothetical protein
MSRRPRSKPAPRGPRSFVELKAEVDRLLRELARAEARIQQLEHGAADPLVAKRLAELEEGQKVARGLAVEAAIARSRAEAELKALQNAIGKATGFNGWLLRRAQKGLGKRR